MSPDENLHHRRSVRMPGFDYVCVGAYFVTIVTRGRAHLFGKIVGEEVKLSSMGRIAEERWREIPACVSNAEWARTW